MKRSTKPFIFTLLVSLFIIMSSTTFADGMIFDAGFDAGDDGGDGGDADADTDSDTETDSDTDTESDDNIPVDDDDEGCSCNSVGRAAANQSRSVLNLVLSLI